MALINQNSIIGVTSITSPSASNVLTFHTNDTTERLRVTPSGVSFSGTNASLDTSGNLTVSGNVNVAGVLTYEDVTSVDSVGIVTAQSGINVTGTTAIGNEQLQLTWTSPNGAIKAKNTVGSPAANLDLYSTDTGGNTNLGIRLQYTGNVGIGTDTPVSGKLHVQDGNIRISGLSEYYLKIRNDNAGYDANISQADNGSLRYQYGPTEALRITSSGVVGINTDVSGNGSGAKLVVGGRIQSNAGGYWFAGANGAEDGWHVQDSGGNLAVVESGVTERLRISSDGNIAIGSAGLDSLSSRTSQAYQSLRIQNANITAGNSQYAYFGVNYYQHTDGVVKYIDAGYSGRIDMWGDYISFHLSNGAAADDTISNSERLRITSDGRVGINEITPDTRLTVNGSINVETGVFGKRFAGSTTVDTGIMVGDSTYFSHGVIEVIVSGNPNHFGSGYYRASSTYLVHIGTGWTGSAISTIINATRVSYGVGGSGNSSEVTATFVLYNALTSTEKNSGTARDANTQLRVKIAGCSTAAGARCFVKVLSNDSWLT